MSDENVEPQDETLKNSPKVEGPLEDGDEAPESRVGKEVCLWNGKEFSDGATVCDSGTRHKCWDGRWIEIGLC
jgi:hypothetical protein